MQRINIQERTDWKTQAEELGFTFHTMYGAAYWDETACYRFSLRQIEDDIEDPSNELEQMCFEIVDRAAADEQILAKLQIPPLFWDYIRSSWLNKEKNLYGRFDFSYDGTSPAKLLEYNADTPTALYESAVFQWVWLEQAIEQGILPSNCDQFNSLHENLVEAFQNFGIENLLHLTACRGSEEDVGTVRYLEECAVQAGIGTKFLYLEEIGLDNDKNFVDLENDMITALFKLYPWEWLMMDEFGETIPESGLQLIEPAWKAILSNKGLMPLLWEMFENHPNLLPAFFATDPKINQLTKGFVKKPLLSREGFNVEICDTRGANLKVDGPYGEEGYIVQALHPLPVYDTNHTVVGSWMVASNACGICLREDNSPITKDTSRFIPHVIHD